MARGTWHFTKFELELLSNRNSLSQNVVREMNRKPYHTQLGGNLFLGVELYENDERMEEPMASKNTKSVSQMAFASHFENLYSTGAIYLWGGNCQTITKDLTDSLFEAYGSDTYNKAYYNNKYNEGKGKIGADCSGALYPLSEIDRTASGYYKSCVTKGLIAAMPDDIVCLVFNKSLTHVAAYLGNGYTIEMKNSKENVHKEKFKPTRWYYYGLPEFVDYSTSLSGETGDVKESVANGNTIMKNFQTWLNTNFSTGIKVDGYWGPNTKTATVKALQTIYNDYFGANIAVDGSYGPKTKEACPGYSKMRRNTEAWKKITYIIHIFLYTKGYPMNNIIVCSKVSDSYSDDTRKYVSEYQSATRGLKIDGLAGTATLYAMFKK